MKRLTSLLTVCAFAATASASDLNLSIESGGQNAVTVSPGQVVTYNVVGELSDNLNEGLALFSIDLNMPGVVLTPVNAPTSTGMLNFALPLGLTNPAGFGGTQNGRAISQIGGMQNTLKNTFAPVPTGTVITGIAANGAPETLFTGQVAMPTASGLYSLNAANVLANVIRQGETGTPTWLADVANLGNATSLKIRVEALNASTDGVSMSAGGSVNFVLDGGSASAGNTYLMLASASGTVPGIPIDGLILHLGFDALVMHMANNPNTAPYANTFGALDALGMGTASLTVPAGTFASLAGATIHHAFVVFGAGGAVNLTSNATALTLLP